MVWNHTMKAKKKVAHTRPTNLQKRTANVAFQIRRLPTA
jgi:hypothetical protein